MTDLRTLIAHYREIEKLATPGPWTGDRHDGTVKYDILGPDGDTVCRGACAPDETGGFVDPNDDRFVIASRNLFAALLDVAEAAEDRLDAGSNCDCEDGECSCGHAALSFTVQRLREAMEANRG